MKFLTAKCQPIGERGVGVHHAAEEEGVPADDRREGLGIARAGLGRGLGDCKNQVSTLIHPTCIPGLVEE